MSLKSLEERVSALEDEVVRLKKQTNGSSDPALPWWEKIYGKYANDPAYEEAMRLGREYRESLRPKSLRKKGNLNDYSKS